MTFRRTGEKKKYSYYHLLLASVFILILFVSLTVVAVSYIHTEEKFTDNTQRLQAQTECNIINTIENVDKSLKLYDSTLNSDFEHFFDDFMAEYEESGRNPSAMDLDGLKKSFGRSVDLYIINEEGVIEYTTCIPDLGMDFKEIPYFYEYLTKIRHQDGFFPDRIVTGLNSGKLFKYAYMPTPDHKYILELSLVEDMFKDERSALKYSDQIAKIKPLNPALENVRIFTTAKKLAGNMSFVPDEELDSVLDKILATRIGIETYYSPSDQTVKYVFIDLMDENYGSDMSLIVEFTYNNSLVRESLKDIVLFHLSIVIIILLLGSFIAVIVTRNLTKPIRDIVDDVDRIARGDLDHSVRHMDTIELGILERSINKMVLTLKETIDKLSANEAELKVERDRAQQYLDTAAVIFMVLNPAGEVTMINHKGCEIFLRSEEEMLGKNIFDIGLMENEKEEKRAFFDRIISGEFSLIDIYQLEILDSKGGLKTIRWFNSFIRDRDGNITGVLCSGEDITLQKEMEMKVRRSIEQIEENMDKFAGLNDSIRNHLSVIVALSELEGGRFGESILTEAKKIDLIIAALDSGWLSSEKVREFLIRHYGIHKPERGDGEKKDK